MKFITPLITAGLLGLASFTAQAQSVEVAGIKYADIAEVGSNKLYLKDDAAKAEFLQGRPNHNKEFQRLKGLGEMDAEELWATTMDPAQRTLLQVSVEQAVIADEVFSILMGDDVESRKHFIQTNASDVRFLDI